MNKPRSVTERDGCADKKTTETRFKDKPETEGPHLGEREIKIIN